MPLDLSATPHDIYSLVLREDVGCVSVAFTLGAYVTVLYSFHWTSTEEGR
jgi:hypothetical protein